MNDQPNAVWNVAQWHGRMLADSRGEKLGKLHTPPDTESGRRLARR